METLFTICLGIGLSAACGFRVFVPLLTMSIASLTGHLTLATGFDWIGTYPALIVFSVATALEIAGYYVPWIDNLLDSVATPAAVVAGTLITAAVVTDMSPLMKWSLALIAGGGMAGIIQATTVALRGTSSATTAGTGNWVVASGELMAAVGTSLLALVLPILAAGLAIVVAVGLVAVL